MAWKLASRLRTVSADALEGSATMSRIAAPVSPPTTLAMRLK